MVKISNLYFGTLTFVFMLFFMGFFLSSADDVTSASTDKVGGDILTASSGAVDEYRLTEEALYDNTFASGTFAIQENQLIETRGISQANIISKDNPATIKETVTDLGSKANIPAEVLWFVLSIIIGAGIIAIVVIFKGEQSV